MILSIENIAKSYKRKQVLNGINISADAGMQVGIVGKNGSGKSTLLSILAGVQSSTHAQPQGRFEYDGVNLLENRQLRNSICAYVPQENPLISELSALDNLKMWYDTPKLKNDLSDGVLKMLGIDEFISTRVSEMSGGMKKRLSIGCAVYADPKVLLLDEPTAGLDIICKEKIYEYLRAFRNSGGIVLLATHDEKEIAECDELFIIKDGFAVPYAFDGSIQNLLEGF